jgi:aspartyl-tRNA(Asn)/glutamyl-tRNA(Gln) amidotransferase subunit C
MADILTRADVERIAALARLELTGDEAVRFAGQLTSILAYADQIRQVDTTGVESDVASGAPPQWREDVPVPSLERDAVLESAPDADRTAGLFKVPRVLGS